MRFISIADLHFALYSNDRIDQVTGMSERLSNITKALIYILDYATENKIDNIIVKGDIIHTKNIIHSFVQSLLLSIFNNYSNLNFYLITGNHDVSTQSGTGVSALEGLHRNNVHVITEPLQIENMLLVPWYNGMVDFIKNNSADLLLSHFGLNEATLSSGISLVSDIKLKDLKNYEHVLLGHYHNPQSVGNTIYSGSIIQLNWGEKEEDKRFLVCDSQDKEIESIPIEGYQKHFVFEVTSENKDEILGQAKELQQEGHKVVLNKTEDFDDSGITEEFKVNDKVDRDVTNRGVNLSMSEDERMERFLDIKGIEDKEEYLEVGREIVQEYVEDSE